FWAEASPEESPVDKTVSPADSNTSERRIKSLLTVRRHGRNRGPGLRLVSLHDGFVTRPVADARGLGRVTALSFPCPGRAATPLALLRRAGAQEGAQAAVASWARAL